MAPVVPPLGGSVGGIAHGGGALSRRLALVHHILVQIVGSAGGGRLGHGHRPTRTPGGLGSEWETMMPTACPGWGFAPRARAIEWAERVGASRAR